MVAFPHFTRPTRSLSPAPPEQEHSVDPLSTPVQSSLRTATSQMASQSTSRPSKRMRDDLSMSLSIPDQPPQSSSELLSTPVDAHRTHQMAPPPAPRALRVTKRLRDAFAVPASQSQASGPAASQGLLPDMSQDTLALFPRIIQTHVRRSRPSAIAKAALISSLNRATALRNPFTAGINGPTPPPPLQTHTPRLSTLPPASATQGLGLENDGASASREEQRDALKKILVCASQPRKFSLDFEQLGVAGEGDFSQVIKARSRIDGVTYAVKRNKKPFTFDEMKLDALNEVFALAALQDHPCILRYHNAWFEHNGHTLLIQTAFLQGGNVYSNYVHAGRKMPIAQLHRLARHVAGAMEFMHRRGVLHNDIKPDNIFEQTADDQGNHRYVIGDFGLATRADAHASVEGDSRYLCPEALNGEWSPTSRGNTFCNSVLIDDDDDELEEAVVARPRKRTRVKSHDAPRAAADVFSFGASVYELATGVPLPKSGETWMKLRTDAHAAAADVLSACGSRVISRIVAETLVPDPCHRASCKRILEILDEQSDPDYSKLRKENELLTKHLKETRAALTKLLTTGTKIEKPRRSGRGGKASASKSDKKPMRRSSRRCVIANAKR